MRNAMLIFRNLEPRLWIWTVFAVFILMHVMTRCASGMLRNNRCHPRCSLIKQQLHFTADNDILMIIFTAEHTAYPRGQFRQQVMVCRKKLLTSKRGKTLLWNCRT